MDTTFIAHGTTQAARRGPRRTLGITAALVAGGLIVMGGLIGGGTAADPTTQAQSPALGRQASEDRDAAKRAAADFFTDIGLVRGGAIRYHR